jgi:hypothetical protein
MPYPELSILRGRRRFLLRDFPAGTLFFMGCAGLFSQAADPSTKAPEPPKHKFLEDSGMNFEDVFKFAYKEFIEAMQFFGRQLGKERLLEMLRKDSEEYAVREAQEYLKKLKANDFATFKEMSKEKPNRFWEHVQTKVIIEETESTFAKNVTECLFAKTFRDCDAADIGYAYSCYYDFPAAQAYNPKLKLIRTKTLMAGDDCCDFRHVWEG